MHKKPLLTISVITFQKISESQNKEFRNEDIRKRSMPYTLDERETNNSPLFTCFTVTVTENSGKTTLSSNFVFSELKIGVESRGIPIETRRVEMGCTPA